MFDLSEVYKDVINSNFNTEQKNNMLLAYMICNEKIINNEKGLEEIIDLCISNIIVLNDSLNTNMDLLNILNVPSDKDRVCGSLINFLNDRDKLLKQINDTKNLTAKIQKKCFKEDLSEVMNNRRKY